MLTKFEQSVFRLRNEFAESTLSLANIELKANTLTLKFNKPEASGNGVFSVKVKSVGSIRWIFANEFLEQIVAGNVNCLITNIWLECDYMEELAYSVLFQGFPDWRMRADILNSAKAEVCISKEEGS